MTDDVKTASPHVMRIGCVLTLWMNVVCDKLSLKEEEKKQSRLNCRNTKSFKAHFVVTSVLKRTSLPRNECEGSHCRQI